MSVNNFKELARLQEEKYGPPSSDVRKNLLSNVRFFQFIGEIVELFIPKVMTLFVRMSGGSPRTNIANEIKSDEYKSDDEYKRPRYPNSGD